MPNIVWNIILRVDDVIDDVTAEGQTRPSIFMFNYFEPSCHSNFIINYHLLIILTRYMCPCDLILNYEFQGQRSKVKVMTSAKMFKSKITNTGISQSIFKLEQNLNNHKIALLKAYLHGIINFRYNFRFKWSPWPQNGGHLEKFRNILDRFILTLDKERPSKINQKKYFWCWWRHSVTSKSAFYIHV